MVLLNVCCECARMASACECGGRALHALVEVAATQTIDEAIRSQVDDRCESCGSTADVLTGDSVDLCRPCAEQLAQEETAADPNPWIDGEKDSPNYGRVCGRCGWAVRSKRAHECQKASGDEIHIAINADSLAKAERDCERELRTEVERLRARLRHECPGCPGCATNDCPDALDVAKSEVERLRAELEQQRTRAEAAEAEVCELRKEVMRYGQ